MHSSSFFPWYLSLSFHRSSGEGQFDCVSAYGAEELDFWNTKKQLLFAESLFKGSASQRNYHSSVVRKDRIARITALCVLQVHCKAKVTRLLLLWAGRNYYKFVKKWWLDDRSVSPALFLVKTLLSNCCFYVPHTFLDVTEGVTL